MNRIAIMPLLALCASAGALARAQVATPQAYTLEARGTFFDRKMTVTIVRDGSRERIEKAIERAGVMATLFDFEARRVYWIGWSGAGTCSSGRYLSTRAPVGEDPVTGTSENLAALTAGRTRKAAGAGSVAGRAARIEELVGGKRPADPNEPWPTRVWLAEDGGYLLKLEGEWPKGKPVTLLEVTALSFAQPSGTPLRPPAECIATDSEMDEKGAIRAHAEASAAAQASGTAELGAAGSPAKAPARAALAKIDALALGVTPQPHDGPCGTRLQLTGVLSVDGPATIQYRFLSSVGGAMISKGEAGEVTVDAAGSVTLVREATFLRSLKGELRLQAIVQGTNGHNGPLRRSDPVPFQVNCAAKQP